MMGKLKWTVDLMTSQAGRVCVVTGANSGIGFETAKALAQKGAMVILACRSEERGRDAAEQIVHEVPGATVEVMTLDLASLASVRAFAKTFEDRFDRLDLLINNAGVMVPPYSTTTDGFELQFGINHLGHFALTGLLLDRLLATQGSRVVVVSSAVHKFGQIDFDDLNWETKPYKKWSAYGQSKLANLLFAYELQRRLEHKGLGTIVTAAHPGWTATNLQRHNGLIRAFNRTLPMKPWQGALPTLFAAVSEDANGGGFFGPDGVGEIWGYPVKVRSSDRSHDREDSARLFKISEEMTGVPYGALASTPTGV